MTKATAYFLDTLRRHLLAGGKRERAKLFALYKARLGKKCSPQQLNHWIGLHKCPSFDVGLVLLRFAHARGLIAAGGKGDGLFIYSEAKAPPPLPAKVRGRVRAALLRYASAGKPRRGPKLIVKTKYAGFRFSPP